MLLFTRKSTLIPPKTERNELIVELKDSGLTLEEIRYHPKVVRLSGHRILTFGRVAQIYRNEKRKGGDKDGPKKLHTRRNPTRRSC